MKDFPENDSSYTPCKSANLSLPTSFAAWLTGSSVDELAFAPDAERRAVRLAGLSLTLISLASMLGWWVAMGIARAEYTPWNLPYAVLSGVLVYTVDRAMLRAHWHRAGLRAAKARNFLLPEHSGWSAPLMHGLLRIVVSVIVSLTTASFIELEIFRHDTDAYLASQNREQNQPVFQAAAGRVDAEIEMKMKEIAGFDDQAKAIIDESIKAQTAAQAAAEAQVQALKSERTALQDRTVTLSKEVDCQTSNGAAEETGGVRCDGTEATAGTGRRYRVAGELADYARAERASAVARVQAIDADLIRLQTPVAGPAIAPETPGSAQPDRDPARRGGESPWQADSGSRPGDPRQCYGGRGLRANARRPDRAWRSARCPGGQVTLAFQSDHPGDAFFDGSRPGSDLRHHRPACPEEPRPWGGSRLRDRHAPGLGPGRADHRPRQTVRLGRSRNDDEGGGRS